MKPCMVIWVSKGNLNDGRTPGHQVSVQSFARPGVSGGGLTIIVIPFGKTEINQETLELIVNE